MSCIYINFPIFFQADHSNLQSFPLVLQTRRWKAWGPEKEPGFEPALEQIASNAAEISNSGLLSSHLSPQSKDPLSSRYGKEKPTTVVQACYLIHALYTNRAVPNPSPSVLILENLNRSNLCRPLLKTLRKLLDPEWLTLLLGVPSKVSSCLYLLSKFLLTPTFQPVEMFKIFQGPNNSTCSQLGVANPNISKLFWCQSRAKQSKHTESDPAWKQTTVSSVEQPSFGSHQFQ